MMPIKYKDYVWKNVVNQLLGTKVWACQEEYDKLTTTWSNGKPHLLEAHEGRQTNWRRKSVTT